MEVQKGGESQKLIEVRVPFYVKGKDVRKHFDLEKLEKRVISGDKSLLVKRKNGE